MGGGGLRTGEFEYVVIVTDPRLLIALKEVLDGNRLPYRVPKDLREECSKNPRNAFYPRRALIADEQGLRLLAAACGKARYDAVQVVRSPSALLEALLSAFCLAHPQLRGRLEACKEAVVGVDAGSRAAIAVMVAGRPVVTEKVALSSLARELRRILDQAPCDEVVVKIGEQSLKLIGTQLIERAIASSCAKHVRVKVVPESKTSKPPLAYEGTGDPDLDAAINIALRDGVELLGTRPPRREGVPR